jgi:hypothetical protein
MRRIVFSENEASEMKDILRVIVESGPQERYTIENVRSALKVIDRIEASADQKVDLEDAEHDFVKWRVGLAKWNAANATVVSFYDAVMGAQQQTPDVRKQANAPK